MKTLLVLAACMLATAATALERKPLQRDSVPMTQDRGSFGPFAREYPYPAEPQYQYPMMDGRGNRLKCPKGTKPFQGVCRKWRRVD
jgi:hypothetical protein